MDIDTSTVDQAREHAELVEQEAARMTAEARHAYYSAVAELVAEHGATAVARALGVTRVRVYQLIDKAPEHDK